jgi:prepilin-type N-terminal cleavage/methylation domain-containing protein
MSNTCRKSLFKGLTMMEMIISLAIMAVIFAAILPQFRNIQNSWASKQTNAEVLQNGRILIDCLNRNLAKAVRITAVSDPCDTTGFIEFKGNDAVTYRCEIGADNIVEFGPVGNLADLGGPVSKLQFTCYDAQDLDTPTTYVQSIRFVKAEITLTNPAPLGQDKAFTAAVYLRTSKGSLVGSWKLDETSGLTAQDSSGGGNDGTLVGMVGNEWTNGMLGGALEFGGYVDYIDCGNGSTLQVTTELTLAAWVKPAALDEYYGIAGKLKDDFGAGGVGDYRGFALVRHADNHFRLWTADGTTILSIQSDDAYMDTDWHHVAGVRRDGTNYLYIDGVRQTATSNLPIVDSGAYFHIGTQYYNYNGRYFKGIIDNVFFYNQGLSDEEIAHMAGTRAGVVGHWKFDETAGSIASDSSGNDYAATVSGATWDSSGQIDGALDFDGSNDYVDTTIDGSSVSNVTFCLWFKSDDVGSIGDDDVAQRFITQMRTSSGTRFALGINKNKLAAYWYDGSSNVKQAGPNLSASQWYHAAVTYDGSDIRLYLDGNERNSSAELNMSPPSADAIEISRDPGGGGSRHFDGLLDDVRVYRRVLTEDEIWAIYTENEYINEVEDQLRP